MSNKNAIDILKLSIELLSSKYFFEFKNKLNNIMFDGGLEPPKINDIFDVTDNYYKDLYSKIKYYLFQYKTGYKTCEIINIDFSRVQWLNFCRLLLLNLKEKSIEKNDIKIIFFLIVNLFSVDTDKNSLEFRNDTVSMLFSQCNFSSEILNYQEIYKIIDQNYSAYYPNLEKDNNFTQIFIERENEKLNIKIEEEAEIKGNPEIENIKNLCQKLPFHLLKKYLKKLGKEKETNTLGSQNLYNFYRNCYNDLYNASNKGFIKIIKDAKSPSHEEDKKINEIISDINFLEMVKSIMKSKVMEDAYKIIFRLYSTDEQYDYNKKKTEEEKQIDDSQKFVSQNNLINENP